MIKKVAIIIERNNINLGGAERSVFELKAQLSAQGIDVDILAANGKNSSKHVKILCQNNKCQRTKLGTFAKVLKKYFKTHSYDIIHSVLPFDFADVYQPRGGTYPEAVLRNAVSYRNSLIRTCKTFTAACNIRRFRLGRAERRGDLPPGGRAGAGAMPPVAHGDRGDIRSRATKF